ncbi:MAG: hypothetical protein ACTHJ0_01235 [Flavipsychrobacter sp.]
MNIVLAIHNIFRWLILLFALLTLVKGFGGMGGKKAFTAGDKRSAMFLMICCDIQLLLGLILYFVNGWFGVLTGGTAMSSDNNRFFSVEHAFGMIVAIILVHIGYSATKKNIPDASKYKRMFWFTLIAVIVILGTIPWPGAGMHGRPLLPRM